MGTEYQMINHVTRHCRIRIRELFLSSINITQTALGKINTSLGSPSPKRIWGFESTHWNRWKWFAAARTHTCKYFFAIRIVSCLSCRYLPIYWSSVFSITQWKTKQHSTTATPKCRHCTVYLKTSLTWESPYMGKTVFILRRAQVSFLTNSHVIKCWLQIYIYSALHTWKEQGCLGLLCASAKIMNTLTPEKRVHGSYYRK